MSTRPGLSVQVSPYKIISGQRHVSVPVQVSNPGTVPETVSGTFSALDSRGGCHAVTAPGWVSVSPHGFTLQPGQHMTAHVIVNAPASATGSYDLAAVFLASPLHRQQGLSVSGGVASRLLLHYGGAQQTHPCVVAAAPHPHAVISHPGSAGFPVAQLGAVLLAVFLAVAVALAWQHRRHDRKQEP